MKSYVAISGLDLRLDMRISVRLFWKYFFLPQKYGMIRTKIRLIIVSAFCSLLFSGIFCTEMQEDLPNIRAPDCSEDVDHKADEQNSDEKDEVVYLDLVSIVWGTLFIHTSFNDSVLFSCLLLVTICLTILSNLYCLIFGQTNDNVFKRFNQAFPAAFFVHWVLMLFKHCVLMQSESKLLTTEFVAKCLLILLPVAMLDCCISQFRNAFGCKLELSKWISFCVINLALPLMFGVFVFKNSVYNKISWPANEDTEDIAAFFLVSIIALFSRGMHKHCEILRATQRQGLRENVFFVTSVMIVLGVSLSVLFTRNLSNFIPYVSGLSPFYMLKDPMLTFACTP